MAAKLRALWRRIQRVRHGEVRLEHVRSHIAIPGNETADWLAEMGASGWWGSATDITVQARGWLREWSRTQRELCGGDAADDEPQGVVNANTLGDRVGVG